MISKIDFPFNGGGTAPWLADMSAIRMGAAAERRIMVKPLSSAEPRLTTLRWLALAA